MKKSKKISKKPINLGSIAPYFTNLKTNKASHFNNMNLDLESGGNNHTIKCWTEVEDDHISGSGQRCTVITVTCQVNHQFQSIMWTNCDDSLGHWTLV